MTERIPILKLGSFLLVSIQVELSDPVALALQDDLTAQIARTGAGGVLIDISGLTLVDSFIGRTIANMASMAAVMDAPTVLVGMQPAVAITVVELGAPLSTVRTALDVDRGLALLEKLAGERRLPSPRRRRADG
jgi:rsbT antagonist protein RsbS